MYCCPQYLLISFCLNQDFQDYRIFKSRNQRYECLLAFPGYECYLGIHRLQRGMFCRNDLRIATFTHKIRVFTFLYTFRTAGAADLVIGILYKTEYPWQCHKFCCQYTFIHDILHIVGNMRILPKEELIR